MWSRGYLRGMSFLYNSINVNVIRTRAWDKCYVLAPLDTLGIPWLRVAPQIAEEDHWQGVGEVVASHLGLEGKAPQALVVLALGLPTLEDRRQVLAGSPATGFRIASLTGGSVGLTHFQTLFSLFTTMFTMYPLHCPNIWFQAVSRYTRPLC